MCINAPDVAVDYLKETEKTPRVNSNDVRDDVCSLRGNRGQVIDKTDDIDEREINNYRMTPCIQVYI